MFTIIDFEEKYLDDIYNAGRICFADSCSKETLKKQLDEVVCYVCLEDEKFIGYCEMYVCLDEGNITSLAVLPKYRGKGAAKALVNKMLKTDGISTFFLEVRQSNEAAIKLYKSFGFEEFGVRKSYYQKPVEDGILMKCTN